MTPLAKGETKLGRNSAAILVIKDPEAEPDTSVQSLQRLYGLTATEAAFVAVFVEETSLKGTAERLSLTMSSARTYLKRVFAKTEVNSHQSAYLRTRNSSIRSSRSGRQGLKFRHHRPGTALLKLSTRLDPQVDLKAYY